GSGAEETSPRHPPHARDVVAPFKIRFPFPDGRTAIREAKAGDVLFSEPVTHATENIGGTDVFRRVGDRLAEEDVARFGFTNGRPSVREGEPDLEWRDHVPRVRRMPG